MEEMKWFNRTMLGVLAANNLGFGLMALAEILCQTFGQRKCHQDMAMACPKSATYTEPSQHCNITQYLCPQGNIYFPECA
jgi:hypothetical protein